MFWFSFLLILPSCSCLAYFIQQWKLVFLFFLTLKPQLTSLQSRHNEHNMLQYKDSNAYEVRLAYGFRIYIHILQFMNCCWLSINLWLSLTLGMNLFRKSLEILHVFYLAQSIFFEALYCFRMLYGYTDNVSEESSRNKINNSSESLEGKRRNKRSEVPDKQTPTLCVWMQFLFKYVRPETCRLCSRREEPLWQAAPGGKEIGSLQEVLVGGSLFCSFFLIFSPSFHSFSFTLVVAAAQWW